MTQDEHNDKVTDLLNRIYNWMVHAEKDMTFYEFNRRFAKFINEREAGIAREREIVNSTKKG